MIRARRARTLAVALISAATLTFEILLVRFFAIEQFHHFAYMAIGVAMLGFGASGTFAALLSHRSSARFESWFVNATLAAGVLLFLSPFLADRVNGWRNGHQRFNQQFWRRIDRRARFKERTRPDVIISCLAASRLTCIASCMAT